jgi:hypothetical protein
MADLRSALIVDCDTGGGTELVNAVNLRLSASGGSIEAIGQQAMASSIPVVLASNQSSITVDTEMGPAGTLADNTANPSVGGVAAFNMLWDSATWDRAPGTAADGMLVNLGANNDVTVTSGTVTADTELLAPAALADAVSNPSPTSLGAYLIGFNGTSWDRVRTANTGRLQVDVITGGGAPPAPTSPLADYVTSAAVAAGAEVQLDSAEAAGKSLAQCTVWSSVAYRCRVFLVNNSVEATEALAVGGGPPHTPWTWTPPHTAYAVLGTTAGADTFRVEFINLDDAAAADGHACFLYQS